MLKPTLALACVLTFAGFSLPAGATTAPSDFRSTVSLDPPNAGDSRAEAHRLAQVLGSGARDRRQDRRDSRQDCRVEEGAVGQDNRECKEDRAVDRASDNGSAGYGDFDESAFREGCQAMDGVFSTRDVDCTSSGCRTAYVCRFPDGTGRACDEDGDCRSYR